MSKEYDKYLMEHRAAVADAWGWILNHFGDAGLEQLSDLTVLTVTIAIESHDMSKYSPAEYAAYNAYFYGKNKTDIVQRNFDHAWLHHIHENPHHWQHWVLMEDDPETGEPFKCLEMDEASVIEMICDWWSFSFRKGNLKEIFDWYEEHKKTIKLHPNTRKEVERILGLIREKLEDEES
jgi:hypothetical protein